MIKIDGQKFEIDGDVVTVCSEIGCLFKDLNAFFDHSESLTDTLEEMSVCNDEIFQEMQKLMVRLNNAHDRAQTIKNMNKLKF